MHATQILHTLLSPVIHLKRLSTIKLLVSAVLANKKLSVTQLGRSLAGNAQEKNNIKRSDRFLSNINIHKERIEVYRTIAKKLIANTPQPWILVDWSHVPNTTSYILRAALVAKGRALTVYEEVHPKTNENNSVVHKRFLGTLQAVLPEKCIPILVTDAGFRRPWFQAVHALGWDYVGRIRGRQSFRIDGTETWESYYGCAKKAVENDKYLGEGQLGQVNTMRTHFYLTKLPKKHRVRLNKLKKKGHHKKDKEYAKSANEPWLLVSSLRKSSAFIIKIYTTRMTIEEGFRDLKSSQYGFSFEHAYSKKIERIQILLMIAMLAATIAYLIGFIAEKNNWQYKFQANSCKNRRILSLFYLGCRVIKKNFLITRDDIISAIKEFSISLEWVSREVL